jgi:Zn-dependent protease
MTRSFRIGRVFGIAIEIDYTWFVVFFLVVAVVWSGVLAELRGVSAATRLVVALIGSALFFASVLIHELSHSVVALRNGLGITGITLFLFGGVSKLSDEPKSAQAEFKIAIAGPITSIVLAGMFLSLGYLLRMTTGGTVFASVFWWLGWVNGMLAIFNLLPGFPLDGGRVLRAGIWHSSGNLAEATRIAATFGQAFGLLMIIGGVMTFIGGWGIGALWLAFIGWFLIQAAQSSYQQLVFRQALSGLPVSSVMTDQVQSVPADITLDRVVNEYVMMHNHPAFPVMDDGELLGLLCLADIRAVPRDQWSQIVARQIVPPLSQANTIAPSADAWEALLRMTVENCGRLLVVENGFLRGIISRTDIMRLMRRRMELGV